MTDFEWVAAFVFASLSSARLTRLVVWDSYPPVARLRAWWDSKTEDSEWNLLLHCGYCFGAWASLAIFGWFTIDLVLDGHVHWSWWAFNGWLSVAYLAAIIMAYDGEED
jgi:hypothetical protein